MSGSIFSPEVDCFDEIAAQQAPSRQSEIVWLAQSTCQAWAGRRESQRPRRDSIVRCWRAAWHDAYERRARGFSQFALAAEDFDAFRLAWIAEFRSYGRQTPECPDTFFATIDQEKAA